MNKKDRVYCKTLLKPSKDESIILEEDLNLGHDLPIVYVGQSYE